MAVDEIESSRYDINQEAVARRAASFNRADSGAGGKETSDNT